jgi:hypothetical protein
MPFFACLNLGSYMPGGHTQDLANFAESLAGENVDVRECMDNTLHDLSDHEKDDLLEKCANTECPIYQLM